MAWTALSLNAADMECIISDALTRKCYLLVLFNTQEITDPVSVTKPWISLASRSTTKGTVSCVGVPLLYVMLPVQLGLIVAFPLTLASGINIRPPILTVVEP